MILRHPASIPLNVVLPAIIHSLPLEDYVENEPTFTMILNLYHANNATMFSLTEQFLPVLAKVLMGDEKQLKPATRVALEDLARRLGGQFV